MLFPPYPSFPFLIRGRFLGLVWHKDQLRSLRLLEAGQEVQIPFSDRIKPCQLLHLRLWEWVCVEGDWIGDLCQSEKFLKAHSVTSLSTRASAPTHAS